MNRIVLALPVSTTLEQLLLEYEDDFRPLIVGLRQDRVRPQDRGESVDSPPQTMMSPYWSSN